MRRIITTLTLALATLTACATDDTPAWVPDGYAPCLTDEAHGPCYWDASKRGGAGGTSFHVDANDIITYIYE